MSLRSTNKPKQTASAQKKRLSEKLGKKSKSPLKHSSLGMVFEFFIIDKNGDTVPEVEKILKKVEEKKPESLSSIFKNYPKNILRVGKLPWVNNGSLVQLIDDIKAIMYAAEEENLSLCPLGTYPGKVEVKSFHENYRVHMKILGHQRFIQEARVSGYRIHHALPWGVFDTKKLTIKKLINSKNKQSLVNTYNFLIAVDPALATFMQSSPFYQGEYLAKDSRLLVWRGQEDLGYGKGVFTRFPLHSSLPEYIHTSTDLFHRIERQYDEWMKGLSELNIKKESIPKYHSKLDTNWSPVRINQSGALEQSGMDANHLTVVGSVSLLIARILQVIQEDYYQVTVSDIAVKEPFKLENKTIYIPPDTYVRKELQKNSAFKGMENEAIWYYCKRLISLGKFLNGKNLEPLLEPLEKMIIDKKTISDSIIHQAKELGHKNISKPLPKEIGRNIALEHSKLLFKEIVLMSKYIEELEKN